MADKYRRTYPISIVFSEGEIPPASKLTGISTQTRSALNILEYAVGDLWNQAGDAVLSPAASITRNALHLPNLARIIGKSSYLNMMIPGLVYPLDINLIYTDDVGARYTNVNRGYIKYKPLLAPSGANMTISGGGANVVQGQFKTTPTGVASAGDWHVDTNGKLYTCSLIPSGLTIAYVPDITPDYKNADDTNAPGWNVIPDPTTWSGNYQGVKISFANNTDNSSGYHIWLPPRKALDATKILSKTAHSDSPNTSSTPDAGTIKYFQSASVAASLTNGDHYRYNLPGEITGQSAGTVLPTGFLYIWDQQTGTILEGCTFYTPANTTQSKWKLRVTGADLPNVFGTTKVATPTSTNYITDETTQLTTDYPSRFKVIIASSSLSKVLFSIVKSFWNHSHNNGEGGKPVNHAYLDNTVTPKYSAAANANYSSSLPSFTASRWANDDHPQYLHRGGSTSLVTTGGDGTQRDPSDNTLYKQLIITEPTSNNQLYLEVLSSTLASIYSIGELRLQSYVVGPGAYISFNNSSYPNWIRHGHDNGGQDFFDTDIVLNASGKIYIGGGFGSTGTGWLDKSSAKWRFYSSSVTAGATLLAGIHSCSRDSTTYIANNFKYTDESGNNYHSALQQTIVHCSSTSITGTSGVATLNINGYIISGGAGSGAEHFGSINLPQGAAVVDIEARMSGGDSGTASTVKLKRIDQTTDAITQVGTTLSSDMTVTVRTYSLSAGANPSSATETSTTLANGSIDKTEYTYFIDVAIQGAAGTSGTWYWVKVYFTVPNLSW